MNRCTYIYYEAALCCQSDINTSMSDLLLCTETKQAQHSRDERNATTLNNYD